MYTGVLLILREELTSKIKGQAKEEDPTVDHRKTERESEYSSSPSISTCITALYFLTH